MSGKKRGKWTSSRAIISIDSESRTVSVPGSKGKIIKTAFEDVRTAIDNESFAYLLHKANDNLDEDVEHLTNQEHNDAPPHRSIHDKNNDHGQIDSHHHFEPSYEGDGSNQISPDETSSSQATKTAQEESIFDPANNDGDMSNDVASLQLEVGDNVEIIWLLDNCFYSGAVAKQENDNKTVVYYDGGIKTLFFTNVTRRYAPTAKLCALSASSYKVRSKIQQVLQSMLDHFGNMAFLRHQAQAFPKLSLTAAYAQEEIGFKKTVKTVPLCEVPSRANIISSNVLYKLRFNYDMSI